MLKILHIHTTSVALMGTTSKQASITCYWR